MENIELVKAKPNREKDGKLSLEPLLPNKLKKAGRGEIKGVLLRLSLEEKSALTKMARSRELSIDAFIRRLLDDEYVRNGHSYYPINSPEYVKDKKRNKNELSEEELESVVDLTGDK